MKRGHHVPYLPPVPGFTGLQSGNSLPCRIGSDPGNVSAKWYLLSGASLVGKEGKGGTDPPQKPILGPKNVARRDIIQKKLV